MIRLLKIDFKKNKSYRTFWILAILYFFVLGIVTASAMEFLKWLKVQGVDFEEFDPTRIPIYYFPDIWQNITFVGTYFKFILAILVIISITNEFSYRTIKQNIIDGMSRMDFLKSKVCMIATLSIASTVFITLIILITGLIYSDPETKTLKYILPGFQFSLAFFLNLFTYLMFALLIGMLVRRSGLSIGLLFIYSVIIENILVLNLPEQLGFLSDYFPMGALDNLITFPFKRYVFMEIRDYVSIGSLITILAYISLYFYLNYALLRKKDL